MKYIEYSDFYEENRFIKELANMKNLKFLSSTTENLNAKTPR